MEQRLSGGSFSSHDVRQLGLNLGEVLAHLHERRLVHRDIKPANIIFRDSPDVPVLTDFGVVRMLDQPTLTRAFVGMGPGTPAYAAPEQLNNEKAQIGWRTDLFGLAVVMAECLLGRHPYSVPGGTIHEAIALVAAKVVPPAESISELARLGFSSLEPALQPWPVSRYRRPEEFIAALQNG